MINDQTLQFEMTNCYLQSFYHLVDTLWLVIRLPEGVAGRGSTVRVQHEARLCGLQLPVVLLQDPGHLDAGLPEIIRFQSEFQFMRNSLSQIQTWV